MECAVEWLINRVNVKFWVSHSFFWMFYFSGIAFWLSPRWDNLTCHFDRLWSFPGFEKFCSYHDRFGNLGQFRLFSIILVIFTHTILVHVLSVLYLRYCILDSLTHQIFDPSGNNGNLVIFGHFDHLSYSRYFSPFDTRDHFGFLGYSGFLGYTCHLQPISDFLLVFCPKLDKSFCHFWF